MKRIKTPVIITLLVIVIITVCIYLFTDISFSFILIGLALIATIMYFSGFLKQQRVYKPEDKEFVKKVKKIATQSSTWKEFKNSLNKINRPEILYAKTYIRNGRIKGEIIFIKDGDDLEIEL